MINYSSNKSQGENYVRKSTFYGYEYDAHVHVHGQFYSCRKALI